MKTCPRCGIEKPETEFYRNKRLRGGLSTYCKTCQDAANRASAAKDPERYTLMRKASSAASHVKHREKRNAFSREYQKSHPWSSYARKKRWEAKQPPELLREGKRARMVLHRERERAAVFEAYGGHICACCGETQRIFLTIDHVENDGAAHRKQIKWGSEMFSWLRRNNFPPGFQVLCRNCNWGKHANGGTCPHQSSKVQRLGCEPVAPSGAKREAA